MIKLLNVLNPDEASDWLDALLSESWETGKNTARGSILNKNNSQLLFPPQGDWYTKLATLLFRNGDVASITRARFLVAPMANKYVPGSYYDWHYDSPNMGSRRADLSFTLFLKPANTYAGGELEIETDHKNLLIKGEAGQMILYPTEYRHRVREIESGERVSIVGWIESWIKSPEIRHDVSTLESLIKELSKTDPDSDHLDTLKRIYRNMRRRAE